MSAATRWRRLIAGEPEGPVLVDIGTSAITGVRAPGSGELAPLTRQVGNPVTQTLALSTTMTAELGSDFTRAGLLYDRPEPGAEEFADSFGIGWLWADGAPSPLRHPLQHASVFEVARYPRPMWPALVQDPAVSPADPARPLVVVDAPAQGLLELCFGLRGTWRFLTDITENWRVANALLDWSLEALTTGYEHVLTSLVTPPDLVIYGDDYGYSGGMFVSGPDFRTFVLPRLRTLFARIRRLCPAAAICFHCCGAIRPILPDLAGLGAEVLNLQSGARDMELVPVRAALPSRTVLHGYTSLTALGAALRRGDREGAALLTAELTRSRPAIAAPGDCLADGGELEDTVRAASYVRALAAGQPQDQRYLAGRK